MKFLGLSSNAEFVMLTILRLGTDILLYIMGWNVHVYIIALRYIQMNARRNVIVAWCKAFSYLHVPPRTSFNTWIFAIFMATWILHLILYLSILLSRRNLRNFGLIKRELYMPPFITLATLSFVICKFTIVTWLITVFIKKDLSSWDNCY